MTAETHLLIGAHHSTDLALHDEIKRRAYELYKQRGSTDGHTLEDGLHAELHRALYATAELEKCANGDAGDTRSVRAARVYLKALSSFISERDGHEKYH